MNKLMLLILLFIFNLDLIGQSTSDERYIIFNTYQDYLKNDVPRNMDFGVAYGSSFIKKDLQLTFTDSSGKKTKYRGDEITFWGYRTGWNLYRINVMNNPYRVLDNRKISVYVAYNTKKLDSGYSEFKKLTPMISKGLNGDMIPFSKSNLMKILNSDAEWLERVRKCENKIESLYRIINEYNTSNPTM